MGPFWQNQQAHFHHRFILVLQLECMVQSLTWSRRMKKLSTVLLTHTLKDIYLVQIRCWISFYWFNNKQIKHYLFSRYKVTKCFTVILFKTERANNTLNKGYEWKSDLRRCFYLKKTTQLTNLIFKTGRFKCLCRLSTQNGHHHLGTCHGWRYGYRRNL